MLHCSGIYLTGIYTEILFWTTLYCSHGYFDVSSMMTLLEDISTSLRDESSEDAVHGFEYLKMRQIIHKRGYYLNNNLDIFPKYFTQEPR